MYEITNDEADCMIDYTMTDLCSYSESRYELETFHKGCFYGVGEH